MAAVVVAQAGNRAERRKQKKGGKAKPAHFSSKNGICHPLPHQVDAAFCSLEMMIKEIKDGNVRVVGEEDTPVIWLPAQGKHVDLVVALNRWIRLWEHISRAFHVKLDQSPLVSLTDGLKAGRLLEMSEVVAAEAVVARQRYLYAWALDVFAVKDLIIQLDLEKAI